MPDLRCRTGWREQGLAFMRWYMVVRVVRWCGANISNRSQQSCDVSTSHNHIQISWSSVLLLVSCLVSPSRAVRRARPAHTTQRGAEPEAGRPVEPFSASPSTVQREFTFINTALVKVPIAKGHTSETTALRYGTAAYGFTCHGTDTNHRSTPEYDISSNSCSVSRAYFMHFLASYRVPAFGQDALVKSDRSSWGFT